MLAVFRAVSALFGLLRHIFFLLRGLIRNIPTLIAAFWPKLVAAFVAVVPFFIDRLLEYGLDKASDLVDVATDKVNNLEVTPFPDIPKLSDLYYSFDPFILDWLEAFRVSEAIGIISAVVTWKVGANVVNRIIGRF